MTQLIPSLRQSLRRRRNAISTSDRARFDYSINQHLLKTGLLLRSSSAASYLANDGEPTLDLFIQACSKTRCKHYLPALNKQRLRFSSYLWGDPLENNRFNIPEPAKQLYLPAKLLTSILIPLVGFDQLGHRIGMGGGYYDRTLNFMLSPACKKKPLLVGIAYSLQMVDTIKPEAWDVPLDAIVTELGVVCFSAKAKQRLLGDSSDAL
ncbi:MULTISPECIES: 5-formyltetrahydrofolate cyclo-ligase [Cycloclasticus]|jgi:5-formyltetrahydrofolate cyclo-ligase|uniref:5-formyltetrahydrofolate cyclo-ligase n=1 Tax=Cycloclasticus TaxID=34067 RepID=UPI0009DBB4D8|nr:MULTISPECIES: 5-formyltetrahydrofolate cyclo-ligase [Cycloclasticus]PHR50819.1 MAG: 5-formyltetrahydrofolate cyclo-ligase [Cycloclasticus sp.]